MYGIKACTAIVTGKETTKLIYTGWEIFMPKYGVMKSPMGLRMLSYKKLCKIHKPAIESLGSVKRGKPAHFRIR
jgi:hypothetical protein